MGPLATYAQIEHIERQVEMAKAEGGTILTGGDRGDTPATGWYYLPTIIECPRQDLTIVGTELFGPVLSVLRFDMKTRSCNLRMTASLVWRQVFHPRWCAALRMTRRLRAGIVWVNTYRVSPIAEFGGFKESGYGRESGMQAIYDYTRPKTAWLNISDALTTNPFVMR